MNLSKDDVARMLELLSNPEIHTLLKQEGKRIDWKEIVNVLQNSTGWVLDKPLIVPLTNSVL